MKIRNIIIGFGLLCVPFYGYAGDFLTEDQIKVAFSGKTVTWEHMFKDKSGKSYYAPDGKITGKKNGAKREGTWSVEDNKLCLSWGKCRKIEADGNGGYYKVKGEKKRVVKYISVTDGNNL